MSNTISEVTRRAIIDHLVAAQVNWEGRLAEEEFLSRLYDLTALPSTDHRFKDAAADIWQHRTNWNDWSDDWIFYDSRFNILHSDDENFLRFLCETVHPVVRPDSEEAEQLVEVYNNALKTDGWKLIPKEIISGRPVFVASRLDDRLEIFEEPTGWKKVDRQSQEVRLRLETARSEEQFQTIGLLCREVLISLAEEVFDPIKHPTIDGIEPSRTDAGRMLQAFFKKELEGGTKEEARAHARAALRLALALQHKRTADFQLAALCSEATASVVNLAAILSGRRG